MSQAPGRPDTPVLAFTHGRRYTLTMKSPFSRWPMMALAVGWMVACSPVVQPAPLIVLPERDTVSPADGSGFSDAQVDVNAEIEGADADASLLEVAFDGSPSDAGAPDASVSELPEADSDALDGEPAADAFADDVFQDAVAADTGPLCGPGACDDGDPCTDDTCDELAGCSSTPTDCDDDHPCTVDGCDVGAGGCVHEPNATLACADGDACTIDACDFDAPSCQHIAKTCNDGLACSTDGCDPSTGDCFFVNDDLQCADGNPCTTDKCSKDGCLNSAIACEDLDKCTANLCTPEAGCTFPKIDCSDGNPCNGKESCTPVTGLCVSGAPIVCDDGDGCNGLETCAPATGECVLATDELCPVSPAECDEDGEVYGPLPLKSTLAGSSASLRLVDLATWGSQADIITALAGHPEVTLASYGDVLQDLNRVGAAVSGVTGLACFEKGFAFDSGDNAVAYWWPQGVAGSTTEGSEPFGTVAGEKVILVSWYHKPEKDPSTDLNKGARVSFVRTTDMGDVAYRNILLVEPYVAADGTPDFKEVVTHAGGIAWVNNWLYVADTTAGFRVFDMSQILRVKIGENNKVGYDPATDAYYAFNYRYVIPMVNHYVLCGESCCARFSFAALDSSGAPTLVSGEYTNVNKKGRIHRWPVNALTGKLQPDPGQNSITPVSLFYPNVTKMQGAVTYVGNYYISSSAPKLTWPTTSGSLIVTADATVPTLRGWPSYPEDLHHDHLTSLLWSATEYPGARAVFAVPREDVLNGCP